MALQPAPSPNVICPPITSYHSGSGHAEHMTVASAGSSANAQAPQFRLTTIEEIDLTDGRGEPERWVKIEPERVGFYQGSESGWHDGPEYVAKGEREEGPLELELNDMQQVQPLPQPSQHAVTDQAPVRPVTPNDLERSNPPTPTTSNGVDLLQTFTNPPMNKWRFTSSTMMNFANGMNDSAPGALLPYLEKHYSVNYAIVSLIFIANALGFIAAAPFTHYLETRFGRARTHQLSLATLAAAYITLLCAPPFPIVVSCFFFLGFGMAVSLALNNVFCVSLANSTAALGILHGAYGVGGTIGPLMATALASSGVRWSYFYCITLFFALLNAALAGWAYRAYELDAPVQLMTALEQTASRQPDQPTRMQTLTMAAKSKTTILGALFVFAYQGAEVSIASWLVSFLISYRHGEAGQVGYVSSGFWLGITLGRFLLSPQASRLGEKVSVVVLVAVSLALQIVFWFVPNIIGNAVAISLVGLLLGPVYPCAAAVFSKLLPRSIQVSSFSLISAMGSSGGAFAPFITGLLAQRLGTVVLNPVVVILYASMVVTWLCLPRVVKRTE